MTEDWRLPLDLAALRDHAKTVARHKGLSGERLEHLRGTIRILMEAANGGPDVLQQVRSYGQDQQERPAVEMAVSDA